VLTCYKIIGLCFRQTIITTNQTRQHEMLLIDWSTPRPPKIVDIETIFIVPLAIIDTTGPRTSATTSWVAALDGTCRRVAHPASPRLGNGGSKARWPACRLLPAPPQTRNILARISSRDARPAVEGLAVLGPRPPPGRPSVAARPRGRPPDTGLENMTLAAGRFASVLRDGGIHWAPCARHLRPRAPGRQLRQQKGAAGVPLPDSTRHRRPFGFGDGAGGGGEGRSPRRLASTWQPPPPRYALPSVSRGHRSVD